MIQPPVPPYGSPERDPGVPAPRPPEVVVGDPTAGTVPGEDCEVCEGTGVVECWSPGGPCPPGRLVCDLCGICRTCKKGEALLSAAREAGRAEQLAATRMVDDLRMREIGELRRTIRAMQEAREKDYCGEPDEYRP